MFPTPSRPSAWTDVLEQIERGLERVIAATAERERFLQTSSADGAAASPPLLEERQTALGRLDAFFQQAERNTAAAEVTLEAGAEMARQWLEEAAALRRRLAEWAGRGV